MKTPKNIDVRFIAGFGPIVRDPAPSRKFYSETLGLEFKEDASGYMYTGELGGVKHFAPWPLAQAAESCFGTDQWPGNLAVPQAWIEFDVGNIEQATAELKSQGYELLLATRVRSGSSFDSAIRIPGSLRCSSTQSVETRTSALVYPRSSVAHLIGPP
jgi:catechol 2,3-dioxygenase-like lactoylglutathione lyase family enzyme